MMLLTVPLSEIQPTATMKSMPMVIPSRGEITIKESVPGQPFGQEVQSSAPKPALEIAAPA